MLLFEVPLNAERSGTQRTVTGFCKGDNESKSIRITLHQTDGIPYAIPDTCTAVLFGKKPDETCFMHTCALEDGRAIYVPTAQTVAVIGTVACQLVVYGTDNEVLFAPKFSIEVDAPVRDTEEIESADELTALDDLLTQLNTALTSADEKSSAADTMLSTLTAKSNSMDTTQAQAQGLIAQMTALIQALEQWNPTLVRALSETEDGKLTYNGEKLGGIETVTELPDNADENDTVYLNSGDRKGFYRVNGDNEWEQVTNTADMSQPDALVPLSLQTYDTLQFRENIAEVPVYVYDSTGFLIALYSEDDSEYIRYTDVTDRVTGLPVPFLTVVSGGTEYVCWTRNYTGVSSTHAAGWYTVSGGAETPCDPPVLQNFEPAKFICGFDSETFELITYTNLTDLPPKAQSALHSLSQMVNVDTESMGDIRIADDAVIRFAGVLEAGRHYSFVTSDDLTLTFPTVGWTSEDVESVLDLQCTEDIVLNLPREKLLADGELPSTRTGNHRLIFSYIKSAEKFAVMEIDQQTPQEWNVPDHPIPFGSCTWDQIKAVAVNGYENASGQWCVRRNDQEELWWEVGDEKTIVMSDGEEVVLQILDFMKDERSDNSGRVPLVIGTKNLMSSTAQMNLSDTNVGGWNGSYMRAVTIPAIYEKLPAELKTYIVEVKKTSDTGYGTDSIITFDKLFLLSHSEVNLGYAFFSTNEARTKMRNGTAEGWFLRNSMMGGSAEYYYTNFGVVDASGSAAWNTNTGASKKRGVCFAFCI